LNPHIFAPNLKPLQKIHTSRMLVFQGPLSNRRQLRNGAAGMAAGWGDSVLVRLAKHIRDYDAAWAGVDHLLTDVAQAIFKINGLANALMSDKDKTIIKRMQMINLARSVVNAALIDKDNEEFERKGTPLAGVADILRERMDRTAAAAGIPTVVLFGISPGGMNATGENDVQIWYDAVAAMQRREAKPQIKTLLKYAFLAKEGPAGGEEPEGWQWKFRSLWQETDAEKADTRLKNAQHDQIYHGLGVVSTEDLGQSRFGGDEYGMDLTIDLKALEDREAQAQEMADVTHEVTTANLQEHGQPTPPKPPAGPPTKDAAPARKWNARRGRK
jgi:phage-related protein (TIGR01555 family)